LVKLLVQFNALPHPLIYTPGDNEWTDCHEGRNVAGLDPLERLAKLRTVFFQGERSLGQKRCRCCGKAGTGISPNTARMPDGTMAA
jgi:hypothetical protein